MVIGLRLRDSAGLGPAFPGRRARYLVVVGTSPYGVHHEFMALALRKVRRRVGGTHSRRRNPRALPDAGRC